MGTGTGTGGGATGQSAAESPQRAAAANPSMTTTSTGTSGTTAAPRAGGATTGTSTTMPVWGADVVNTSGTAPGAWGAGSEWDVHAPPSSSSVGVQNATELAATTAQAALVRVERLMAEVETERRRTQDALLALDRERAERSQERAAANRLEAAYKRDVEAMLHAIDVLARVGDPSGNVRRLHASSTAAEALLELAGVVAARDRDAAGVLEREQARLRDMHAKVHRLERQLAATEAELEAVMARPPPLSQLQSQSQAAGEAEELRAAIEENTRVLRRLAVAEVPPPQVFPPHVHMHAPAATVCSCGAVLPGFHHHLASARLGGAECPSCGRPWAVPAAAAARSSAAPGTSSRESPREKELWAVLEQGEKLFREWKRGHPSAEPAQALSAANSRRGRGVVGAP